MKYCPNCGSELSAEAKFCPACGYMISDYASASDPLPEKEIFPDPESSKKGSYGFEAESGNKKYDPFSSEKEPRYSDYMGRNTRYESSGKDDTYDDSGSYEFAGETAASETNGYAIAALVLGIASLFLDFLIFIPSVLAVIFGILGLKRSEVTGNGRGMSIAGIVLGIISFAFLLILIVCLFVFTGVLISL